MTAVPIGLVFPSGLDHCRNLLRGVRRYAEAKPDWVFFQAHADPAGVAALRAFRPAGLVAYACSPALARALRKFDCPVVNVCGVLEDSGLPTLGIDNERVGEMAAGHLLDRGLRAFAYLGHGDFAFSVRREAGFRRAVGARGYGVHAFRAPAAGDFDPNRRMLGRPAKLRDWLRSLPRPVGLFACHDICAAYASEVCRQANLRVPDDVAVVGVDDDDLLCELARPPLSSIRLPSERIGFDASALLDRLCRGEKPPAGPVLLAPLGVTVRRSSDVQATADPDVRAALAFIRSRPHAPIAAADVAREATVCRRVLERRFRRETGRSLGDEIRRVRLERAKQLLVETHLSVEEVAGLSGCHNVKQLWMLFRQQVGQTPRAYRAMCRPRS
jgi:LacI family transcriptional regulator